MNPFKSLINVIRLTISMLFLVLAIILTYLLAGEEYINTQAQIKTIRTRYISNQKEMIQNRVQQAAGHILHQKSLAEKRVDLKVRTLEAYGIEEKKIKKEVLEWLEKISYGNSEYIFAGTYNGLSLSGPFKGYNLIEATDSTGKKIIQDFIRIARQGGGFIEYVAPKYKGREPSPKLSYVEPIEGWNWYVGTGVYTDAIEKEVMAEKEKMKEKVRSLIIRCIGILSLFWIFSYFAVGYLSGKIKTNQDIFSKFFKQPSNEAQPIDTRQIVFSEFKTLADFANKMSVERKKFEDALLKSKKEYEHLFNSTPAGVYELDLKNIKFVTVNDYLCDYIGYEKEELLASSPLILLTEESQKKFVARYTQILSKGKPNDHMECDVIKKNGEVFAAVFRSEFIYKNDLPVSARVVVTDISRIKKMEAMMVRSEKMMSLGGLAAGMAHEINNPLAGITQNAQLLQSRLTQDLPANKKAAAELGTSLETIRQYMDKRQIFRLVENINDAGGKAAEIIQNVLSFANKSSAEKSKNDITELLEKAIVLAQNDFDLKMHQDFKLVEIIREYARDLPQVKCDAGKIQQVLFNLLKNASESMSSKNAGEISPSITLNVSSDPEMVYIRIQDNGVGMDKSIQKRIFEPFYTTKDIDEGKGLGLSISYFIIVNDHGGTIEVASEIGEGTTFTIGLPV